MPESSFRHGPAHSQAQLWASIPLSLPTSRLTPQSNCVKTTVSLDHPIKILFPGLTDPLFLATCSLRRHGWRLFCSDGEGGWPLLPPERVPEGEGMELSRLMRQNRENKPASWTVWVTNTNHLKNEDSVSFSLVWVCPGHFFSFFACLSRWSWDALTKCYVDGVPCLTIIISFNSHNSEVYTLLFLFYRWKTKVWCGRMACPRSNS